MSRHLHLPLDMSGRHFIMGDPHGRYYEVQELLHEVGFDDEQDYLYFTGDVIDRGPDSFAMINMLDNPRVFSVMGNHEYMVLNMASWENVWLNNGGEECLDSLKKSGKDFNWLKQKCNELPITITVGEEDDPYSFRIVHADMHFKLDWDHIDQILQKKNSHHDDRIQQLLWGRDIYKRKFSAAMADSIALAKFVKGLNPRDLFMGHSGVREVTRIGNAYFMDGGNNKLHIYEVISGESASIDAHW